jgi:COP9 signalosome complex subunit 1
MKVRVTLTSLDPLSITTILYYMILYYMILYYVTIYSGDQQQLRRPSKAMDSDWITATEASNRSARHVLQGRLSTAQSHLHKEAIRTAYLALAQQDAKTGELRDAMGSLLRATDYCTTRSQTAHISLLILELALGMENYAQVREYVTKVEHTLGGTTSTSSGNVGAAAAANGMEEVSIKLKIASGLQALAHGDYGSAASCFTNLCRTTTNTSKLEWPGVTCAEDIALYASLLALATQGRASILELSEHPEALELVPHMKELLSQWSRANYVKCMEAFTDEQPFLGDLYVSGPKRWPKLGRTLREKCLMEYLKPYQCVKLDTMSQLFPSIPNLLDTLVDLMGRGLIENAKLDCRTNVLYKTTTTTQKSAAPPNITAMEQRILDDAHAMLIRLACLEYDLCVQDSNAPGRRRAAVAAAAVAYGDDGGGDSSGDESDTPMLDADPLNSAANPEDLY